MICREGHKLSVYGCARDSRRGYSFLPRRDLAGASEPREGAVPAASEHGARDQDGAPDDCVLSTWQEGLLSESAAARVCTGRRSAARLLGPCSASAQVRTVLP